MDTPEPAGFGLNRAVRFGLDRDVLLSNSAGAIAFESWAMLDSGDCTRWLLRGGMPAVWTGGGRVFDPVSNVRSPEGASRGLFGPSTNALAQ